uniref:E3 ubiquitin-protein ligase RNF8-like n=1 Tax=Styela clava TaxID=7725 RepID=UPI00193983DB|nr:E3 ubiquitin-protein ligase RNF8-like [Styela clava]
MELFLSRVTGDENRGNKGPDQWIPFSTKVNGVVTLGRSSDLPIRLLSQHVSRTHAEIMKKKDGNFYIKDLNSLNGIHVNGVKIENSNWHRLSAGDKVEIGRPDDEEILKTMSANDRFIYNVLSATNSELDSKPRGPKTHMSESLKKGYLKLHPAKSKRLANGASKQVEYNKSKNKNAKIVKINVPAVDHETNCNDKMVHSTQNKNNEMKIETQSETNHEMERENKRLKLQLEEKEQALKEEINLRNKRIEDEQKKITQKLEQNFKTKLVEKEEELEMRLQLEKDIAFEQCKASFEKDKVNSSTIKTVVDTMENELQCAICSELFIVSTTLNCAHTFCEYCINEWKNVNSICPVCRQPILTLTQSLVLDNYISKALEGISPVLKEKREKIIEERKKIESEIAKNKANRGRGRGSRGGRGRGRRVHNSPIDLSRTNNDDREGHSRYRTRSRNIIIVSDDESSDSEESDSYSDSDSSNEFGRITLFY